MQLIYDHRFRNKITIAIVINFFFLFKFNHMQSIATLIFDRPKYKPKSKNQINKYIYRTTDN